MKTNHKARRGAKGLSIEARTSKDVIAAAVSDRAAEHSTARPISRRLRIIISLALVFHLSAVFVAALRMPPYSELVGRWAGAISWYVEAVLIDPGYRFFAPDPGPADMMRVVIVSPGGQQREEVYPDLKREWPRLRYHRHFMLTSRLSRNPGEPMVQAFANCYARHILAREAASEVRIFRLVHLIPTPDQVLSGTTLADQRLYRTEFNSPAGVWTSSGNGPFDRTRLEIQVDFDGTASLEGEVLGKAVHSTWTWQLGPPGGPPQVGFFAPGGSLPAWTADWPEPNNLVLHYPLSGARVGAGGEVVEHISARRETPPLAVSRREQP